MIEQRSQDWFEQRAGRITASRFADVIAISKRTGKPTEARQKYMRELAFERTAGAPKHSVESRSLTWGTEVEQYAREAYELETGLIVTEASFLTHPKFDFIGGSPDGLVGSEGLIEIKSPHDEAVHINTWLEGMPEDHKPQVQGNLMVTGRKWLDFISYDPRQGEKYRLYVERIHRDQAYIDQLLQGLLQFEAELKAMIAKLEQKAA